MVWSCGSRGQWDAMMLKTGRILRGPGRGKGRAGDAGRAGHAERREVGAEIGGLRWGVVATVARGRVDGGRFLCAAGM